MQFEEVINLIVEILNGKLSIESKEVKAQKKSGVIYIPKRYVNKRVILIMES